MTLNGRNYGKAKDMLSFNIVLALNYLRDDILKKIYPIFLVFFFGSVTNDYTNVFTCWRLDKEKWWNSCCFISYIFGQISKLLEQRLN